MSANSKQQSDKEKVWQKLSETESERRFREITETIMAMPILVDVLSGHDKDEK